MSIIAPAANTVDWLSGAWSYIQSSSGTGIAILDALSSSNPNKISAGFDDTAFNALSVTLTSVAQNFVQQQNILVGQAALARVQSELKTKLLSLSSTGSTVNKTA